MIAVLVILALVLAGARFSYQIAFYAPRKFREQPPTTSQEYYDPYRPRMRELYQILTDRPCEYVSIRSRDGLILSGRYYHTADGAPLDIGFHGYKSHPLTDFSGGSGLCLNLGHNLLLIDQRSHHRSQGTTIAFGILERYDVLSWVDYALERFGKEVSISLIGISMGASTVLMASDLPLPPNVKGIIADCPYAVPEEIILDVGRKLGYPPRLIRPFVRLGARVFGGFRLRETDAIRAVAGAKVPILILHGQQDGFVPQEMSARIAAANPRLITRHTFPGAEHGISFLTDEARYTRIVKDFLNKVHG